MKKKSGYFGLGRLLSIICAIIPITNVLFGIIIRIQKGKLLLGILNIFLCPIFYIVDLVSIIINNKLSYLI
ncbi:MAG: hypothetical protein GX661_02910 [Acholeplasmataceae bacterium]|nr:hypothetical protein [Acholeplasmataceae bacterium]